MIRLGSQGRMKLWLLALAVTLAVASPAAAATTFYSSPKSTRTTQPCAQATPCKLDYAMLAASASGDKVMIAPGDYYDSGTTPYAGLPPIHLGVTVSGTSSTDLPVLHGHVGANATPFLTIQAGGGLLDVELVSDIAPSATVTTGTTLQVDGVADRIIARATAPGAGTSMIACGLGGKILDSLCLGGGPGYATALAAYSPSGQNVGFPVRNVTAISTAPTGVGLVLATDTGNVTMIAQNVIAGGPTDVVVNTNVATGTAKLDIDHSNWTSEAHQGQGSSQILDGGGNQHGMKPLFVNAAGGDYREARGSPTIDAGSTINLPLALGGLPRSLGAELDIGAYEYQPTPTAVTGAATGVTETSATLNGTATPDGRAPFTARFEYGTTTAYGRTATVSGSGAVSAAITGLAPDTTYHYRLTASSPGGGTSRGQDRTFHTLAAQAGASAAVVSGVSIGRRWRLGNHLPRFSRRRPPVGTTIRFSLTKGARVTLTFRQRVHGKRRPVKRGTLKESGFAGRNKVRFEGRLSRRKKLKPGRYVLTISVAGSTRSTSASFTIVR